MLLPAASATSAPAYLQRLQHLLPVRRLVLKRLHEGARVHGLDLDNLVVQHRLDLVRTADDESAWKCGGVKRTVGSWSTTEYCLSPPTPIPFPLACPCPFG